MKKTFYIDLTVLSIFLEKTIIIEESRNNPSIFISSDSSLESENASDGSEDDIVLIIPEIRSRRALSNHSIIRTRIAF